MKIASSKLNPIKCSFSIKSKRRDLFYKWNDSYAFYKSQLTNDEDVILIKDVEKLDMWYFLRLQVHLNDHTKKSFFCSALNEKRKKFGLNKTHY